MKQSLSLSDLARELRNQTLQKKDYIVDTRSLALRTQRLPSISSNSPGKTFSTLRMESSAAMPKAQEYSVSENAHLDLSTKAYTLG